MPQNQDRGRLSEAAAELYERLLVAGGTVHGAGPDHALAELREWGLVWGEPGQELAQPPEDVTRRRAKVLEDRAEAVRESGEELAALWRRHQGVPDVELLTGDQVTMMVDTLLNSTRHTLLSTSLPPTDTTVLPTVPDVEADALARGVHIRAIYSAEVLDAPNGLDLVRACVGWGEEARLLPNVPGIFMVCDNEVATVVTPYEQWSARQMFVFRSPGMVEVLRRIFERLWAQSLPVDVDHDRGGDARADQQLLVLLANGLSDRAVARELGISERTLSRRITTLSHRYGAQSRFQLGFQAARLLAGASAAEDSVS